MKASTEFHPVRASILLFLCVAFAVAATGCASVGKNLSAFVANLPPNTLTDATQTTTNPLYSHTESVTGMSKSADGTIQIVNLKASLFIPLWGFTDTLTVSGLTVLPGTSPLK